jgi:hypothetical protein
MQDHWYPELFSASAALFAVVVGGTALALAGSRAPRARPAPRGKPPPRPAARGLPRVDGSLRGTAVERRASPRRACFLPVLVTDGEDAGAVPAWVVERSLDGVRLVLPSPAAPGSVLRLRAAGPENAPWTDVRVRHCQPEPDGGWHVDCEFRRTPPWNLFVSLD